MKALALLVLMTISLVGCSSERQPTERELIEARSVLESAQGLIQNEMGRTDVRFATLSNAVAEGDKSIVRLWNDSVMVLMYDTDFPSADVKTRYSTPDSSGSVSLSVWLHGNGWERQPAEYPEFTK